MNIYHPTNNPNKTTWPNVGPICIIIIIAFSFILRLISIYSKAQSQGGYSPERWRLIRDGENTLLGLFFVKNARNVRYAFRGSK